MAQVNSAGTMVAAVLENAGYVTQGYIIQWFESLWSSLGGMLFTLAIIGAVISVVMFESYRWARYLFVGPAIFAFLLFWRVPVEPVVYKLGGGDSQQLDQDLLNQVNGPNANQSGLEISGFFAFYTNIISNLTNQMVDLVLMHENDKDLFMSSRRPVLDFFVQATPGESDVNDMVVNNLFQECRRVTDLSVALSDKRFGDKYLNSLQQWASAGNEQAQADITRLQAQKTSLQEEYTSLANRKEIPVKGKLRNYLTSRVSNNDVVQPGNKTYAEFLTGGGGDQALKKLSEGMNLSCNQIWEVSFDALIREGGKFQTEILENTLKNPIPNDRETRIKFCEEIASKLHTDYVQTADGDCDLSQTIAVNMMSRMFSEQEFSKTISRKKTDAKLKASKELLVNLNSLQKVDFRFDEAASQVIVAGEQGDSRYNVRLGASGIAEMEIPKEGGAGTEWVPINMTNIEGVESVAWGIQQKYESTKLLQEIYTYAMNLPYYQGVLLYFISVAYPFMCFLVLVPSRAMAFTAVPLAWLWVKSWDIGFATVMILDKVLWQLLPASELGYNEGTAVMTSDSASYSMPLLVQKALEVDPSYDSHAHYHIIATVLMAVPAITGSIILKGRKAALASFIQAPASAARTTGGLAALGFSIQEQNIQQAQLNATTATAGFATIGFGKNIDNGIRGAAAKAKAANVGQQKAGAARDAKAIGVAGNAIGHGRSAIGAGGKIAGAEADMTRSQGALSSALASGDTVAANTARHDIMRARRARFQAAKAPVSAIASVAHDLVSMEAEFEKIRQKTGVDILEKLTKRDIAFNAVFNKDMGILSELAKQKIQTITAMDGSKGGENPGMASAAIAVIDAETDLHLALMKIEREIKASQGQLKYNSIDAIRKLSGNLFSDLAISIAIDTPRAMEFSPALGILEQNADGNPLFKALSGLGPDVTSDRKFDYSGLQRSILLPNLFDLAAEAPNGDLGNSLDAVRTSKSGEFKGSL